MRLLAGFACVRPVMIPQSVAQPIVAGGAAELLDVLMLVERGNALRRQLSADPIRLLDEVHVPAAPGGGERGGNAAGAASDNEHVARDVTRGSESGTRTTATDGSPFTGTRMTSTRASSARYIALNAPWCSAARARSAGRP